MARKSFLFTSESVSEGHPDKVCDRISDEVVDAFYREGAKEKLDCFVALLAMTMLQDALSRGWPKAMRLSEHLANEKRRSKRRFYLP